MTRFTRHLTAWIACMTMLFAAMAPSIAQAMSAARGNAWTEVCTVAGTKLVKLDAQPADPATEQSLHLKHCPFCATHADVAAPFPASSIAIPALDAPNAYPALFYQSHRPLAIWRTAQSRAPPSRS
jgi:hypothetical protein